MQGLLSLSRSIDRVLRLIAQIGGWLGAILVTVVVYDVVTRYFGVPKIWGLTSTKIQESEYWLHSFLIVDYASADGVSLDVGFYYMANAMGRLLGTILSGWVYQAWGLAACLWISALFLLLTALLSVSLPRHPVVSAT